MKKMDSAGCPWMRGTEKFWADGQDGFSRLHSDQMDWVILNRCRRWNRWSSGWTENWTGRSRLHSDQIDWVILNRCRRWSRWSSGWTENWTGRWIVNSNGVKATGNMWKQWIPTKNGLNWFRHWTNWSEKIQLVEVREEAAEKSRREAGRIA